MSKNEEFIKEYLNTNDYYEGVLRKISKEYFNVETKNKRISLSYLERRFEDDDVTLHPLQKIYIINDSTSSYDNGAFEFDYQFMFKYKGECYHFISYGGN